MSASVSVSVNGGDFRFAVPPNPGTVRIHVGFTDCGESSGTAGTTGSAISQPPGTPILHRVRTPKVVCALGSSADFGGLEVAFCGVVRQSGTASASASASAQYII